jgi:hypothetical protein
MRKILLLGLAFALTPLTATVPQSESAKERVEQYWKLDTGGAWMSAQGQRDLQDLSAYRLFLQPIGYVWVLKDYRVGDTRKYSGSWGSNEASSCQRSFCLVLGTAVVR